MFEVRPGAIAILPNYRLLSRNCKLLINVDLSINKCIIMVLILDGNS